VIEKRCGPIDKACGKADGTFGGSSRPPRSGSPANAIHGISYHLTFIRLVRITVAVDLGEGFGEVAG